MDERIEINNLQRRVSYLEHRLREEDARKKHEQKRREEEAEWLDSLAAECTDPNQ